MPEPNELLESIDRVLAEHDHIPEALKSPALSERIEELRLERARLAKDDG